MLPPQRKTVRCPNCDKSVEEKYVKCPECGKLLSDAETSSIRPGMVLDFQTSETPVVTSSTLSIQDGTPIELAKISDMEKKINIMWGERIDTKEGPALLHFPNHVEQITPPEVHRIIVDLKKCYEYNIPNACPGLLRKALASSIKIKFYMEKQKKSLYDSGGNRKGDLLDWIDQAKLKGYLTQELAKQLKRAKIFCDVGVHDERIEFDRAEVAEIFDLLRLSIEHMFKVTECAS